MKSFVRCLLCLAAAIAALCAAERKPLTNADVIKMVKAELPESTVVVAIQSSAPAYDTAPEALIALKAAGVSPAIIEAMITARAPADAAPEPPEEAEVEKTVAGMAKSQSEGVISLAAFTKTDGQKFQERGAYSYTLDFVAIFGVREDAIWKLVNLEPTLSFHVARKPQPTKSGGVWDGFLHVSQNPGLQVAGGSSWRVIGQIRLTKSESGWRIVSMTHRGITQADASAVTAIRGEKNAAKLKDVPTLNDEHLAKLMATPVSAAAEDLPFASANGKMSAKSPAGFKAEKFNGEIVGKFSPPSGPTDRYITVSCVQLGLLARNKTLASLQHESLNEITSAYPGAVVSAPVACTLAGADAFTIAFTVLEGGKVMRKAMTAAVSRKHVVGVVLHTTPEGFTELWDAYRRVCESYVLTVK